VEGFESVELFAHAGKLDRLAGNRAHGERRTAARIAAAGDQWFVEDLGSTNGTYIGTVRITQPTTITLGTQVRIGKTILELRK